MSGIVIVDVDGTVALRVGSRARGPFDWHRVGEDRPNPPVIAAVEALAAAGHRIVFLSGRESVPGCYEDTFAWLERHVDIEGGIELYMRAAGDHRRDTVVKREMFDEHLAGREVLCVFDDRDQVVRMWRQELELPCFQVAYGDF
ncbi:hypothetical protein LO763_04840 [Glycomyces sp. A-F 0318]|uniref:phosphatase domain-containing protein n=1 Tax=Glycomyces amatae TaxID=2881355 RepID=UPI001E4CB0B3|nr:hypothetical protein [Glycomyces amatae]MCD0442952.1 hypothetical protein [Glycomyces amatae]